MGFCAGCLWGFDLKRLLFGFRRCAVVRDESGGFFENVLQFVECEVVSVADDSGVCVSAAVRGFVLVYCDPKLLI